MAKCIKCTSCIFLKYEFAYLCLVQWVRCYMSIIEDNYISKKNENEFCAEQYDKYSTRFEQ